MASLIVTFSQLRLLLQTRSAFSPRLSDGGVVAAAGIRHAETQRRLPGKTFGVFVV
jgi:hypothetical protein